MEKAIEKTDDLDTEKQLSELRKLRDLYKEKENDVQKEIDKISMKSFTDALTVGNYYRIDYDDETTVLFRVKDIQMRKSGVDIVPDIYAFIYIDSKDNHDRFVRVETGKKYIEPVYISIDTLETVKPSTRQEFFEKVMSVYNEISHVALEI